jgi:hypothetical protein
VNEKVAPNPSLGDAHISPPWASMIEQANRQSHAHSIRLGGEESGEQPGPFVGVDAGAGVLHGNKRLIGVVPAINGYIGIYRKS